MRSTYTYALMDVSPTVFDEIRQKLLDAGYSSQVEKNGVDSDSDILDMHGIALVIRDATRKPPGFYQHTLAHVRKRIEGIFPETWLQPVQNSAIGTQHVMWMVEEIEQMDRTLANAVKAARWLGWILKAAEEVGMWTNETSRDLVRKDVAEGNDVP